MSEVWSRVRVKESVRENGKIRETILTKVMEIERDGGEDMRKKNDIWLNKNLRVREKGNRWKGKSK